MLAQNQQRTNVELKPAGRRGVGVGKLTGRLAGRVRHRTLRSQDSGSTLGGGPTSVPPPMLNAGLCRGNNLSWYDVGFDSDEEEGVCRNTRDMYSERILLRAN